MHALSQINSKPNDSRACTDHLCEGSFLSAKLHKCEATKTVKRGLLFRHNVCIALLRRLHQNKPHLVRLDDWHAVVEQIVVEIAVASAEQQFFEEALVVHDIERVEDVESELKIMKGERDTYAHAHARKCMLTWQAMTSASAIRSLMETVVPTV